MGNCKALCFSRKRNNYQVCQVLLWFDRVSTFTLRTSLWLLVPCTCSLFRPHIYSPFPIGGAFGIQSNICGEASFCRWLFLQMSSIVDVWQDSKWDSVQWFITACTRFAVKLPSLGFRKGILDSPCLLILLIYTEHKNERWNLWLTLCPHFASLKLCLLHFLEVFFPIAFDNDLPPPQIMKIVRNIYPPTSLLLTLNTLSDFSGTSFLLS